MADPYTLTHLHHGMLLYALLRLLARRLGSDGRFSWAVTLEAAWEIGENTKRAIRHYRRTTEPGSQEDAPGEDHDSHLDLNTARRQLPQFASCE